MMTRRLLIWLITCILIYWVIVYTGFEALIIVLLVLLLMPLFAVLFYLPAWSKIQIEQLFTDPIVERLQEASVELKIKNPSNYFFPYVSAFCIWHNENGEKQVLRKTFMLKPKSEYNVKFACKAYHCGIFPVGIYRLALRDVFGFFYWPRHGSKWWRNYASEINVIPGWQKGVNDWTDPHNWPLPGLTAQKQVSSELDALANIRDYQAGDSMKRIHWKLSARLDSWMVKEYEDPKKRYICFSLDAQDPHLEKTSEKHLDWLLETAATAMRAFLQNKRQIKWLDTQYDWQLDQADRLDQFDLIRQSMSHFNWNNQKWTDHLTIRLEHQPIDMLVLVTWRIDQNISNWTENFLQGTKQKVMLLWLKVPQEQNEKKENGKTGKKKSKKNKALYEQNFEIQTKEKQEQLWNRLLHLGVQGHIVQVIEQ